MPRMRAASPRQEDTGGVQRAGVHRLAGGFFSATGFWGRAQKTAVRSFGLGTGTFALWMDTVGHEVRVRHYDARIVVPLSWDT